MRGENNHHDSRCVSLRNSRKPGISRSTDALYILIALTGFLPLLTSCHPKSNSSTPDYILRLDSLIERNADFEREKLLRIEDLRQKCNNATSIVDKYSLNSLLFDEYSTYNSDSARKYINQAIDIARQAQDQEWSTRSKIKKAEFLTGTGLLSTADALMSSIDRSEIPPELLADYYGAMIYLYSHMGNYAGGKNNDYYIKERLYKDSIMMVIDESHPSYLWYKGWDILGTDKPGKATIEALNNKLSRSSMNTHQDAKDAYILGKLYEQEGDQQNYRRSIAESAGVDVKIANYSEISSLEELSHILFNKGNGDINHAYEYINYCLGKAISYPNRVKAFGISESLGEISKAYQDRNRQQQKRTRLAFLIASLLAVVLAAAVTIIIIQNRRLRRRRRNLDAINADLNRNIEYLNDTKNQLNEANTRLTQLIEDLKSKNEELNEANYVKEEYICNIFTICSTYISKMADLKRHIHLKLAAKKYRDIERVTEDFDMKDEFREFYKAFDTVFLHIYPDFVHDFNALLQPDKQIIPKEGELLNTELRIYALIRLGITDSIKIAEFLHCSPQTVYNNRFKVRNKAIISKKDFAETVRRLGQPSEMNRG